MNNTSVIILKLNIVGTYYKSIMKRE